MTPDDRFDGTVPRWLQERAGTGAPDYLDDILGRTARTRQRPGWLSIERWPPTDISANGAFGSRLPLRTLAIIAILALLIAAVVAVGVGSRQQQLPAPFGTAANGVIVYGSADGDIRAFDPQTGISRALVADPSLDQTPILSPDGSTVLFSRGEAGTERLRLMVANADGSEVRPVTELIQPESSAWSPDSTRLAIAESTQSVDRLSIVSLDGTPPVAIPVEGIVENVSWRSTTELVFLGRIGATYGFYVVGIDGAEPRPILPVSELDTDWIQPVVSPDGSRIAYTKWGDAPMTRVVDIDTGVVVPVEYEGTNEGDGFPSAWSPDGTQLVFTRWNGTENHLAIGSVDGGPAVEIGPGFPDFTDGASGVFSPDGRHVIARYGKEPFATWLLDTAGGPGEQILTDAAELGSWQRRAP